MSKGSQKKKFLSIDRKLLMAVLAISSCATFIFTIGNFYLDYQTEVQEIESTFDVIKANSKALSEALYNLDEDNIKSHVEGIMSLAFILDLEIIGEDGISIVRRSKKLDDVVKEDSDGRMWRGFRITDWAEDLRQSKMNYNLYLFYTGHGKNLYVGQVKIVATKRFIYDHIFIKTLVFFLSQGLKTFLVTFFLLWVFRRFVSKDLVKFSSYLTGLDAERLERTQAIQLTRDSRYHDEIGELINKFNEMLGAVQEHQKSIKFLFDEGQNISNSFHFEALEKRIKAAVERMLGYYHVNLKFYVHSRNFIEKGLSEGFYLASEAGSTPVTLDELDVEGLHSLKVVDPRANVVDALISLELDEKSWDKVKTLLEILATNVANSLGLIRLGQITVLLEDKNTQIRSILENIQQGIFMIDGDAKILGARSTHMEKLAEKEKIKLEHALKSVISRSNLSANESDGLFNAISMSCGSDLITYNMNKHLFPRYIEYSGYDEKKFEFDWIPIFDEDEFVYRIMVNMRDITELEDLRLQSSNKSREMERVYQLVKAKGMLVDNFFQTSRDYLERFEQSLEGSKPDLTKGLSELHTIKGNARSLGFLEIAEITHELEGVLNESQFDRLRVHQHFTLLMDAYNSYSEINKLLLERQNSGQLDPGGFCSDQTIERKGQVFHSATPMIDSLRDYSQTLARELQVSAPKIDSDLNHWGVQADLAPTLASCFCHLLNNSMDHGLLAVDEGRISIKLREMDDKASISFFDTGRGLDMRKLRQKFIELKEHEPESDHDAAQIILSSGFSTKPKVSQISGRGVGMSAVKLLIEEKGGRLAVSVGSNTEEDFRSLKVELIFDRHLFAKMDASKGQHFQEAS